MSTAQTSITKTVEDDLICPITQELPIDPVTAEDGTVYERAAIKKYFATKGKRSVVKSPTKGKMMGQRLFPAPHMTSLIETLVDNGSIDEDMASAWKQKHEKKKEMTELLQSAEAGDVPAMMKLGTDYLKGASDCGQDLKKSFHWFNKARLTGNVLATTYLGQMMSRGVGVAKNERKALLLLGLAAGRGSDFAAFLVANAFMEGTDGLAFDADEAAHWFKLSLDEETRTTYMGDEMHQEAQLKLKELGH